jgi:uncharacterized protein (TIGR02265 family)
MTMLLGLWQARRMGASITTPMVKGTLVVTIAKFLRSRRDEVVPFLPEHCKTYLHERALDSSWYPETDFLELIRAASRLFPGSRNEQLMALGSASLQTYWKEKTYEALHRTDMIGMPRRMVALWSSQHNTGQMKMQLTSDNTGTISLVDFGLPSNELCNVLTGYLRAMLEANGSAAPRVEKMSCRLDGVPECTWRLTA